MNLQGDSFPAPIVPKRTEVAQPPAIVIDSCEDNIGDMVQSSGWITRRSRGLSAFSQSGLKLRVLIFEKVF